MISARLVLAALVGGQLAVAGAASVAEPVRAPATAPSTPPAPDRNPARLVPAGKAASTGQAPSLPEAGQAAAAGAVEPDAWAPSAIAEARARCAAVLKGLDVAVIAEEPIKEGDCGAAAPVRLVRLGKNPEVVLSPPATVTCDMVAQLDKWLRTDVQPLARKLLGAPVVKIETMSSYSCRNAYGRAKTKLSEHGRANALDIGGFQTANAEPTSVLASWGPTARETRARALAAAKAAEQKAAAEAVAAAAGKPAPATPPEHKEAVVEPATAPEWTLSIATQIKGMLGVPARLPGASDTDHGAALGLVPSSRLGGPKPNAQPAPAASPKSDPEQRRSQFLRQAHAAACKHFGTVLGPEANDAHKNHLHIDMADRQRSNFCE